MTPQQAMPELPEAIQQIQAALDKGPTPGPWSVPHYCQEGVGCDCTSILCEAYFGAIATIHFNDGLPVSEGGGDDPIPSEAKANGMLIAACNPENIREVLTYAESLRVQLEAARAALRSVANVLQAENQNPTGAIRDTIWYSDHETLFDFIGAALNTKEQSK